MSAANIHMWLSSNNKYLLTIVLLKPLPDLDDLRHTRQATKDAKHAICLNAQYVTPSKLLTGLIPFELCNIHKFSMESYIYVLCIGETFLV